MNDAGDIERPERAGRGTSPHQNGHTGTEAGMGERLSRDGVPVRHRHAHPGPTGPGPSGTYDCAALETALAAALRTDHLDAEAEQRAVAVFRAATQGAGARRTRTRRRDDWRPAEERRVRRPVRLTFGVAFASLALGGVAVAAIGSAGSPEGGAGAGRKTAHPSAVAPHQPGGTASPASSGGPVPAGRPSLGQDTEARCRAYEQAGRHGRALDATAWQRLVATAGGKDQVAAYCSEQLARATAEPRGPAGMGRPGKRAAHPGNGTTGNTGVPGHGASGTGTSAAHPGSTHDTAGNRRASGGGKGGGKHP
ncbi:hypothetical protein ACFZA1_06060 [Streptomyces filipinensis]|uniref:hypothetical protein n=1 Tax=Streptomyces filipinensis TaxID=66887 RepID=UPI0036EC136B